MSKRWSKLPNNNDRSRNGDRGAFGAARLLPTDWRRRNPPRARTVERLLQPDARLFVKSCFGDPDRIRTGDLEAGFPPRLRVHRSSKPG